jgi:hypothetical protein
MTFLESNLVDNQLGFLTVQRKPIQVDRFIQTKSVSVQRLEEPRHKKLKKMMSEKLLPTHLEVALVLTHFTDDYYEQNNYYSINGNTRKFIWNMYPEMKPEVPLYCTIYNAYTREQVNEIYRSIDSSDSVESVGQMMGGLCRDSSFIPVSKYVGTGKFATALRHAYCCIMNDRSLFTYKQSSFTDIKNKEEFKYFYNEIQFLDKIYQSFESNSDIKSKMNYGSVFAALLIICKKYGINNPKVTETINKLVNNIVTTHEGYNGLNDGVSVVFIELYDKFQNQLQKWSDTSAGYGPVIIGNILYCLDSYMNDNLITIKNTKSSAIIMRDNKIIEYFTNYNKL